MIERNELESARFGVEFARLVDPVADVVDLPRLVRAADDAGVDVISARVNIASLAVVRALEDCGFRIMDTLVYYRLVLPARDYSLDRPGLTVSRASEQDAQTCGRIAASAFRDYVGHYHADPKLNAASADAAYVDWTIRLLREPANDQIALCARAGEAIVGYLVGARRADGAGEIVLNAVDPAHQRQGCYNALLSAYILAAERRGDHEAVISTQLQNHRVQRVWHRHGFMLFDSYHTLHRWRPAI